jgi:asparagine synthase (glutamine-hydrolysing)
MCGIVGGWGLGVSAGLRALAHRGPDGSALLTRGGVSLGHARLAVIDPTPASGQPFERGPLALSYNGELWNYRALRAELAALGDEFRTAGDTEVVAAALARWGADALPRLDGMFALAWTAGDGVLWLARDRFGEVPLHVARQRPFLFASELKALRAAGSNPASWGILGPGRVARVTERSWQAWTWYDPPAAPAAHGRRVAASGLRALLAAATGRRAVADVPCCTLLSGGVDSAVVCALLAPLLPGMAAYTAVMDLRSPDLPRAREAARAAGVPLVEVRVPPPTADDLARTVRAIEMPSKAQVEIAWPCLHLAAKMRADGFRVTFSGEGSDELWASYGFAYHGLQKAGWHEYRKGLFLKQHRTNFARANKAFMAHGVECRLPFLDVAVVEWALSLTRDAVQDGPGRPKAVLQDAAAGLVSASVARRPKLAFQDGLGMKAAAARAVTDPKRFYAAEFARSYGPARADAVA